jgi:tetratricopeptide (TPR) repeat protein/transglutaminase-like putative cysteine protease
MARPRPAVLAALPLAALLLASTARGSALDLPAPGPGAADPLAERFTAASSALERNRRTPEGLADLAALSALEGEFSDLGRLAAAYDDAAADPAAWPEVRALARFRLAELERSRGNLRKADAQMKRLGFVSGWQVIGPFDDEGKRGLATPFPPEKALDPNGRYPGKEREVTWRPVPRDAETRGFIHLGATLRPSREVAAYALTSVVAPTEQRVQLWFGASGAARVWVNGALAVEDTGYHQARIDQRGATVTLRKGANRILVKLCHQDGLLGFFLRLADARGEGLAFPTGEPFGPAVAPGPAPARIDDAATLLTRRAGAARGKAAPQAHAALAAVLQARAADDETDRRAAAEAARAAALAPRSLEAQLTAAGLEEDRVRRRVVLDAALRLAPADPRVLRAVAEEELEQGRPQAAARLLGRAITAAPGWAEPRTAMADALERSGLIARAALIAEETARRFPTSPAAVRAAARAAIRLGRVDQAIGRERTLLALRFDDPAARASLAGHLLDRGDLAGAVALIEEGLRLTPSDLSIHLRLADLLAANDRMDEAEAAYARALALCPEEADAWERRGRARLLAGRAREAKADLAQALALRPQNPALKELVRSLTPDEERFWKPYQLDAAALLAKAPAPAADEDAIILGDVHVTRVLPSGLSSSYTQRIVKVLTPRGADAFRRQNLAWTPDRQELRVERAVVVKPDGRTVESHDESVESASEPWYRLYYDLLSRTLSFPALQAGDVLELSWRVDDTASENLLSDYFGDFTYVDESWRKARFDYVLLVPEGRSIYGNDPAGVQHAVRDLPGGVKEHRYTSRDLPRLVPEPGMPGWSEVARYLHVSTYQTWEQVNQFYWHLVRDQLKPSPEVRAAAEQLARGVLEKAGGVQPARPGAAAVLPGGHTQRAPPDPPLATGQAATPAPALATDKDLRRALVRAAYDFVVTQTRYVGLEFGIHGYKPYRVDQILGRRFGDCKDKASLMHALLESMGIDSRLVLLRMRRLGRVPEKPASLSVFNHAILYVPDLDLWLDGTAAYTGSRELPAEDRGATVLVVNPDGPPRFGTIPDAGPGDNRLDADLQLTLAPDGGAAVTGAWHVAGQEAPEFRRAYGTEDSRRALLEQTMGRLFPGVRVETVSVSDLSRIEDDVDLRFTLSAPRAAQADGPGLRFTPFGSSNGYAESYAPLSTRKHDLETSGPRDTRFRYRYALPPGWRVVELPEAAKVDGPLGGFEVRYREEAGAVVAEGRVVVASRRVTAKDYPAFRDLMVQIDRAFARRVRVAPARTAEAP